MVKNKKEVVAESENKGNSGNENNNQKYVVLRNGIRVSDVEYDDANDPAAISERDFWNTVVTNWSKHEPPVLIVPYDNKKHRVW